MISFWFLKFLNLNHISVINLLIGIVADKAYDVNNCSIKITASLLP